MNNKTNKKVGVAGISEVGLPKIIIRKATVSGIMFAAAWVMMPAGGAEAAN